MKTSKLILITLTASVLFITGCPEKEITNPFDEGCPKELFTPAEFKSAMEGNAVKLSWTQANMQINGFVVNRSENDGTMAEVARIDKATKTWTDTKVAGGTKYNYQLYAYAGANLSNPLQSAITTPALGATVTTVSAASDITATSATIGGNVTDDGGSAVTERGICYGTSQNPTTANSKLVIGTGKGIFSNTVTGLTANTTYYVRAYATNSYGTAYGSEISFKTTEILVATVTTALAENPSANSVVLGGNVTGDGNSTVTENGICYSTTENPTVANNKVPIGSGTGTFSKTITGLIAGTTYFVRAYAINSQGTSYGVQITFTTSYALLATVSTAEVATFGANSAVLGGNVTNDGNTEVTENGVCYSLNENPTTSDIKVSIGTGTGVFSKTVTGLIAGTKYYVRAYAINSKGTAYGALVFFTTTQSSLATVSTTEVGSPGATSAVLGGNVSNDGNSAVTERGVCYATTQNPTTANSKLVIGTGTGIFSATVSGLTSGTTYYVRAYAINSKGTAYGEQITFTTQNVSLASVTTADATGPTSTSAVLGGNVTNDGGATVIERGICYNTAQDPTTANNKVPVGNGSGVFSTTVTGLTEKTTYYVKAYAINSKGTAYGPQKSFTTSSQVVILATLSSTAATDITSNSAVVGGNITDEGGGTVTERGICYSNTTQNPTTSSPKVVLGSGAGLFSTTIVGLAANSRYYVRAYAVNSAGINYGVQIIFDTSGDIPVVSTKDATNILETSAIAGGIITEDKGSAVTERGICYGTSTNPTIFDSKIASGSGIGGFNIPLTLLTPNTTYYTRAYATNKNGTAYGENKSFKTKDAYYAGFEDGMPAGWSGMWTVSTYLPYEGYYCLFSGNVGDSIKVTLNITNSAGGQISFVHKSDDGSYWDNSKRTEFYIDNKLQATFNEEQNWTGKSFAVTQGTHTFKWVNRAAGGWTCIDYLICPK
jgi:hypothetical protein